MIEIAHEIARQKVKIRYDIIMDNPYDSARSLEETIDFLLKLPKPLSFNVYSLQYFPRYPLTQKALADGHINESETDLDNLQARQHQSWGFAPRLFPLTRKQMLQNLIWLIIYRHPDEKKVKRAVFRQSWRSRAQLFYLNVQAVLWGKMHELKRMVSIKTA
jgi:hypothetical protein